MKRSSVIVAVAMLVGGLLIQPQEAQALSLGRVADTAVSILGGYPGGYYGNNYGANPYGGNFYGNGYYGSPNYNGQNMSSYCNPYFQSGSLSQNVRRAIGGGTLRRLVRNIF